MHYLFASESLGKKRRLFAQIADAIGGEGQMATYRNVEDFSARLRRHNGPGIMILLVSEHPDLERLTADREILLEADVVLLVPDSAEDTIATAHTFRPSYVGSVDCDLGMVVPVLEKLVLKRGRRPEAESGPGS